MALPFHRVHRSTRRVLGVALVALLSFVLVQAAQYDGKTLVAHRGASAYAPEHTLAAYRLALEQGADFVEQDLGVTRDGVLVCLHDDSLERTTNVERVFPDRFTEDERNGRTRRRWLVGDFTLAEIRRLDAGRWFGQEFTAARVPTWQEAIDLVRGRAGLFPELKSPAEYEARGIDMPGLVVDALRANGLDLAGADPSTPVIIQSFDEAVLRAIATVLPSVPRVFLLGARDPSARVTDARLQEIARFATGIGPAKAIVSAQPDLVQRAHRLNLSVTPYTFRSRSTGRFATVTEEMTYFLFTLGVDALFTDNPDQFPRRP